MASSPTRTADMQTKQLDELSEELSKSFDEPTKRIAFAFETIINVIKDHNTALLDIRAELVAQRKDISRINELETSMGELKSGMQILEFNIQGFDEETAPPSSAVKDQFFPPMEEAKSAAAEPQAEEIEDEEPPPEEHPETPREDSEAEEARVAAEAKAAAEAEAAAAAAAKAAAEAKAKEDAEALAAEVAKAKAEQEAAAEAAAAAIAEAKASGDAAAAEAAEAAAAKAAAEAAAVAEAHAAELAAAQAAIEAARKEAEAAASQAAEAASNAATAAAAAAAAAAAHEEAQKHCVFLEKLPLNSSGTALSGALGEHAPAEVEVLSAVSYDYAYLRYATQDAAAAAQAFLGAEGAKVRIVPGDGEGAAGSGGDEFVTAGRAHLFPLGLADTHAALISGLDPALSCDEANDLLRDLLFEYHVEEIHTKFGKGSDLTPGFALVETNDPVEIIQIFNDMNGMVFNEMNLHVRWLQSTEQRDLERYIARIKRLAYNKDDGSKVLLVGGFSDNFTSEDLAATFQKYGVDTAEVMRDRYDRSFRFGKVFFKAPMDTAKLADILDEIKEIDGSPSGICPIVKPVKARPSRERMIEVKKIVARALRTIGKDIIMSKSLLKDSGVTKEKIKSPKGAINNRIAECEENLTKLLSNLQQVVNRLSGCETTGLELNKQVGNIRAIDPDADFASKLDARVTAKLTTGLESLSQQAADKAGEAVIEAVETIESTGLITKAAGKTRGYAANQPFVVSLLQGDLDRLATLNKTQADRVAAVEKSKLDEPALLDMVVRATQLESGDDGSSIPHAYETPGPGANPIERLKFAIDRGFTAVDTKKLNKVDLANRMNDFEEKLADDAQEQQQKMADEFSNIQRKLDESAQAMEVSKGEMDQAKRDIEEMVNQKQRESNPLPELLEAQRASEERMRSAIGEQLEKIGAQNDELKRLAASLDEVPSESQINEMLEKLEETCREAAEAKAEEAAAAAAEESAAALREDLMSMRDDMAASISIQSEQQQQPQQLAEPAPMTPQGSSAPQSREDPPESAPGSPAKPSTPVKKPVATPEPASAASSGGRAATVSTADADRRAHPNIEFQQKSSPFQGPDLGSLFEMLKYEMRRKTTRGDVLRLVHSHLKQVAEVIEREFNVLRGQLVVQSAHSTAQRHYERLGAEASIMSSSSSVGGGSLNAGQRVQHKRVFRGGMQAGNGGANARGPPEIKQLLTGSAKKKAEVPQTFSPRQNQLVLASYPNGRGGALRPLHRQVAGRVEHQLDLSLSTSPKKKRGSNRGGGR